MALVKDVASYLLNKCGDMSAMKLQKLCYYGQAWHLVWEEKQLFEARIEAWANGPVIPDLYRVHRGRFILSTEDVGGDPTRLTTDEASTLDAVLDFYGEMTAHELSDLTHREDPWALARAEAGLAPMQRGDVEIPVGRIHAYYLGVALAEDV